MEPGNRLLDDYVLGITGVERPRVCFGPTASGDADHFRGDKGGGIDCDVAGHLLAQGLIYVGGGSVISLLGVWRAHGLDEVLRAAWQRGTVLCGLSAGSLCWFREAITAFHGRATRIAGLGLLPWSNCVHYDGERGGGPSTSPASRRG
jgi:dipeptidase E